MFKRVLVFGLFILSVSPLYAQKYRMGYQHIDPRTVPWMKEVSLEVTRQVRDSVDHSHGMPPVGWQYLGSCSAFSTGYYYKAYQEYVDHGGWDMTDSDHQFHQKFIYNQINGGVDGGSNVADAMKCLCDLGIAPMSSVSYADYDSVTWPSEQGYNDAIAFRSDESFSLNVSNDAGILALKDHMSNDNDCAVIAIYVWSPFYYNTLGPNHIYDTGDATGTMWGGHAICLVGYNDSLDTPDGKGAFRLVNSWGTGWGDAGYAWITYAAVKSSSICYGTAYWTTDRRNYQPNAKIAYQVSHNERLDVYVNVGIGPYGSPHWQRTFLNWAHAKVRQYPCPAHPIILDITEGEEFLSPYTENTVFIKVRDTESDGVIGVVQDFSALSNEWGFHCPYPDTPVVMADWGYTNLAQSFPNNKCNWQSFHRLPDNSGAIDLVGDMDSSVVLWTFPTSDSIVSSPIIADIDGDNTLDIVVGSYNDTVYAIDANGTDIWKYCMTGNVIGSPATADLDEDGKLEVVVSSDNKEIVCLNGENGSFNWSYTSFINGVSGSPAINSVDSDRRLEVVGVGLFMRLINGEDGSAGAWLYMNGAPSTSSPAVGDVFDADGIPDIVVGNQAGSVKFFNGKNGDVVGNFLTNGPVLSSPAIGDLDGDSLNEVVVGSNDDTLYALQLGLDSILWKYGTGGDVQSSPALGDIDGDSKLEVVFGSNDGYIYALNAEDGSFCWSYSTGGEVISSPALGDIDSNGVIDVVVGSKDGYLYCLSGAGVLLWRLNLGTPITSSPALGDVDKDGYLEIVVGGLDGNIYLIDGVSTGIGEEEIKGRLSLSRLSGPVSGEFVIRYGISGRTMVDLSIFDISGREVKTIVNRIQDAGLYQVKVNLDNVANGVYFYRLSVGDKNLSRKMVVVR